MVRTSRINQWKPTAGKTGKMGYGFLVHLLKTPLTGEFIPVAAKTTQNVAGELIRGEVPVGSAYPTKVTASVPTLTLSPLHRPNPRDKMTL